MISMTRVTGIVFTAIATMATTAAATPARANGDAVVTTVGAPQTGTYRATFRGTDGSVLPALITIERLDGSLGVLVVMEAPTALDIVSASDTEVVARMRTTTGYALVTLKLTPDTVTGTVTEGKKIWSVDGKRTS